MLAFTLSLIFLQTANDQEPVLFDASPVKIALQRLDELLMKDTLPLWDTPLKAPMLFVEPESRSAVSNQFPGENVFTQQDQVWVGTVPSGPDLDQGPLTWAGTTWHLVHLPLPADRLQTERLLVTTLWRAKALDYGLRSQTPRNQHLASVQGRVWMRLEWQALAKALQSKGFPQRAALADALTFRRHRRELAPNAAFEEQQSELLNGLGAYSHFLFSGHPSPIETLLKRLPQAESQEEFPTTFAQWSGPAYGLLLDMHRPGWRKQINANQDLGLMLEIGMKLIIPKAWYEAADLRAEPYNINQIRREEEAFAERRARRLAQLEAEFAQMPQLRLPLADAPNLRTPAGSLDLGAAGRWFPRLIHTADWGRLDAAQGVRVYQNQLFLPLPFETQDTKLTGKGWVLDLAPDWQLFPGDREGDLVATLAIETEEESP